LEKKKKKKSKFPCPKTFLNKKRIASGEADIRFIARAENDDVLVQRLFYFLVIALFSILHTHR